MSDVHARASSTVPPSPHLVKILGSLGVYYWALRKEGCQPEAQEAKGLIDWFVRLVHTRAGIPERDLLETVNRLAWGLPLDEIPPCPEFGLYGKGLPDLNHVAARLHELDKDGETKRLWHTLYRSAPFIRTAYDNAFPELSRTTSAPVEDDGGKKENRNILVRMALAELLLGGPNAAKIARKIGVPRTTMLGWPEFSDAYRRMRNQQQANAERRQRRLCGGDQDENDEDE